MNNFESDSGGTGCVFEIQMNTDVMKINEVNCLDNIILLTGVKADLQHLKNMFRKERGEKEGRVKKENKLWPGRVRVRVRKERKIKDGMLYYVLCILSTPNL